MLIGGFIALIVISIFVFPTEPDPSWGKFWMIRPLIITPLAGVTGGAVYHFINSKNFEGLKKILALMASILIYIIGLWMGIVLGLDGTLWN